MCLWSIRKIRHTTLQLHSEKKRGKKRVRRRGESKSEQRRQLPNDDDDEDYAYFSSPTRDAYVLVCWANEVLEYEKICARTCVGQVCARWTLILQLEALKTENQRLKDENGALIRVISKLSR